MSELTITDSPLVAISYHEEDVEWRYRLLSHLSEGKRPYQILENRVTDSSSELSDAEARASLQRAKVLVLLISPRFMSSTWFNTKEGAKFFKYRQGPRILALIIRDTDLQELSKLPAHYVPLNVTPVADATTEKQNSILARAGDVVNRILEDDAVSTSPQTEDKSTSPNIADLTRFELAADVEEALLRARALATSADLEGPLVTTSCLFFGLAEIGRETLNLSGTSRFLWKELTRNGEETYKRAFRGKFPKAKYPPKDSVNPALQVTPNVIKVFEFAESVSRRTNPWLSRLADADGPDYDGVTEQGRIWARHLLAALLGIEPSGRRLGVSRRLEKVFDFPSLRTSFYEFIVKQSPKKDHELWKNILSGGTLPQAQQEPQSPEHLEVKPRPGNAVLRPSVAGFMADEWTGRDLLGITRDVNALASLVAAYKVEPPLSIGLFGDWGSGKSHFMRQMRKRVELLSQHARDSKKPQNELGYYKNIVQIEFNAWHYIEGNLWASLVDHIFANLKLSEREPPKYAEQRRDELLQKLGLKEELKKRIDTQVEECEQELRRVEQRKQEAETELNNASTKLQDFRRQATASLETLTVAVQLTAEERELLNRLGISAPATINGAEVRKNYDKLKGRWNRLKAQWRLFQNDKRVARRYLLSTLIVLFVVVGPLLLKLGTFPRVPTALVSILGFVATFLAAARPAWSQFQTTLRALEKYDQELERERSKRITELESEVRALGGEVVAAKLKSESVGKEIDQLKTDIASTSSSRLLAEFIEDRAAASDYRRHLGLLALIRRDFEKLRDLFDQQRQEEADGKEVGDDKKINRIVLYIDDLDRCPPDRVVNVLQAIHLLLAFPLFVVVVGVDSRWITRSLQQSYEWLREADEERARGEKQDGVEKRDDNGSARGATPHDYLEKIFQIPFWLRSMNENACVDFLDGLTKELTDNHAPQLDHGLEPQNSRIEQIDTLDEEVVVTETPAPLSVSSTEIPADLTVNAPVQSTPLVNTQGEIDLAPRSLMFTTFETDYMKKLVPLIGRSPRAVKRFLNCYRLIKVGLTPAEFDNFVGENGQSDSYKAAMMLLGVVTGAPLVSPYMLNEMRAQEIGSLDSFITALESKPEIQQHPDRDRLIAFFKKPDLVSLPLLEQMKKYAPRVARFSFTQPG